MGLSKPSSIYADFHVHTRFSPCGDPEATLPAMITRAREKGLAAVGFADHVTPEPIPGCRFYDGQQLDVLVAEQALIAELREARGYEVLVGVEADYTLAGTGCVSPEMVALVDHIVCSASHFHLPAAPRPSSDSPQARAMLMVRMAREMLEVPAVTVWAHPFDCSAMRPLAPIMANIPESDLVDLVQLANAREVAVEINGGPARDLAYRDATQPFFELARELGARFTLTADAHHPRDFGRLDLALAWAREMGFHRDDFLDVDQLRERHRRKRSCLGPDYATAEIADQG
ncbi:MAG: PHP domain-containing protein [Anaerolineae bacterium]